MGMCSRALEEVDLPAAPAPAVDLATVAAAAAAAAALVDTVVLVVMVALSPSPQCQQLAQAECIKKESSPSSLSETLEFDPNLYPFMVLSNIIKRVQQELNIPKISDSQNHV